MVDIHTSNGPRRYSVPEKNKGLMVPVFSPRMHGRNRVEVTVL